jgi:alpha-ketoglutaric semialdehyde dehydrogenase
MAISVNLLIGSSSRRATNGRIPGLDAASGNILPGEFGGASIADVEDAARYGAFEET